MKTVNATAHAKTRMRQRAISEMQIRLIQEFGQHNYQKGGGNLGFIPAKTLANLRQAINTIGVVSVVLGESDKVITAFHQTRRVRTTKYAT